MMTEDKQKQGIGSLVDPLLRNQTQEESIQSQKNLFSKLGENIIARHEAEDTLGQIKQSRIKGGLTTGQRHALLHKLATSVHDDLKNKLGKRPPLKVFKKEMMRRRPKTEGKDATVNKWWEKQDKNKNNDTMRDWWRTLNKGEKLF